jgi:pyruvate ferredoxin oxidoreductase gamma subunit
VLTLPATAPLRDLPEQRFSGGALAGGAARLLGVIPREALAQALRDELATLGDAALNRNLHQAGEAFDMLADHAGCVTEAPETPAEVDPRPVWIDLPWDDASLSAPFISVPATSDEVPTGLWRTIRPVIDYDRCHRCVWICSTLCPDGVISPNREGYPVIDYKHCKGCLICLANCPSHAIRAVSEEEGAKEHLGEGARGH